MEAKPLSPCEGLAGSRTSDAKQRLARLRLDPVNPAPAKRQIDIPTFITKTNPQPRSELYFQNLAKYLESTKQLETLEETVVRVRLAKKNMEMAILVEDVQLLRSVSPKRTPSAEYFSNRCKYMKLVEDLRAMESSLIELEITTTQLKLALLQEELPLACRRRQDAESHTRAEFDKQTRLFANSVPKEILRVTTPSIDSDSDTRIAFSTAATSVASDAKTRKQARPPFRSRHGARVRSN